MTTITLINGSKVEITSINIKGKIIDSNGTQVGGATQFTYGEGEVDALNAKLPLQSVYDSLYPKPEEPAEAE
ncbi:MAG: hypothetical protein J6P03_02605 [Opitutales bacterium]|nr:hypothetical protein [Opitutales bacterium]